MPDRKDEKEELGGQVVETSSSDSFIARGLQERKDEYYATGGRKLTVDAIRHSNLPGQIEILKPGSYTSAPVQVENDDQVQASKVLIDFNKFKKNSSGVGRNIVADRQKRRAA